MIKTKFSAQSWWKEILDVSSLGTSLFTAVFIAAIEIIFVISFIALIYSGDLAGRVPQALGFIILGDAVLCIVVALASSSPTAIAIEQDAPGVMLSVVAAGIAASLTGSTDAQFATVTMMIILTSIATGLILVGLGTFNLGRLVRFLPFPIIGGFLAATGWLLVQGGIGLMVDLPVGAGWFQPGALLLWVPGFALAAAIYFLTLKIDKPYTIPGALVAAGLVFFAITRVMNIPLSQLQQDGWLLRTSIPASFIFPLSPKVVSSVDWKVLLMQIPALLPVSIISVIALLLNSTGLELVTRKDLNLNRELVVTGIANAASGLTGGLVGYASISYSALNQSMSGGKRLVGIFSALLLVLMLFFGMDLVLLIPKFIFGAVLIFLGLGLLVEWVYEAFFKFPRIDFLVIMSILFVVVFTGFLQGIIAGLVLAIIMFAISYSQVRVVKFALSGREFHSRVVRPPAEQQVLDAAGEQIHLLKLDGFIFFGTANGILSQLREKVASSTSTRIKYILLDFSRVSGMDSTGMLSFARLIQWAGEQGILLIFSGLSGSLQSRFKHEAALAEENQSVKFMDDLDHGLEWCENELIRANLHEKFANPDLASLLEAILPNENAGILIPYLVRCEFAPGEFLVREGGEPDMMYFIESGQVTAQITGQGQKVVRLETMHGGRTIGEMGFYTHRRRSASVVADEPTVAWSLSAADLKRMEAEVPLAASIFHRMVVLLLSIRMAHLTNTVAALERA